MNVRRACLIVQVLVFASGCTHLQLRKNAAQQLRTTSDIHQQQVMDNIAKISQNPSAWPGFSKINSGLTQLSVDGSANVGLRWSPRSIIDEMLGISARRALTESWTTVPIVEAPRVRAMWAVYHYAIYGYIPEVPGYSAEEQLRNVYGPDWEQMLPPPGWFCITTEHDSDCTEKIHCGCVVGRHCETRAYVKQGQEASLQQLTYLIMDLATVEYEQGFPTGNPALSARGDEAAAAATADEGPWRRMPARENFVPIDAPALSP